MGWSIETLGDVTYSATVRLVFYECPECGQKGRAAVTFNMPGDEFEPKALPCGCEIYLCNLDQVTAGWR